MSDRLIIVQGADTFYVFAEGDEERAQVQHTVCVGANQDAEMFRVSEAKWGTTVAQFADEIEGGEVEVIDCRPGAQPRE